jgi:hypothetical protein
MPANAICVLRSVWRIRGMLFAIMLRRDYRMRAVLGSVRLRRGA